MRILLILTAITVCVSSPAFHELMDLIGSQPVKTQFKLWHFAMKRPYDLNSEVAIQKYKVFKANLKFIENANSSQTSYKLGLGPFTDLTWEEFKTNNLMKKNYEEETTDREDTRNEKDRVFDFDTAAEEDDKIGENAPEYQVIVSRDWKWLHPRAKDQGGCGSCWAFAAVASLEAQLLINGIYTTISEQELVDCASEDEGCDGGRATTAFKYVRDNGIATGNDYIYIADSEDFYQKCKARKYTKFIKGLNKVVKCLGDCSPHEIKQLMDISPVATSIEVEDGLQHYREGTWYPTYCDDTNHAVEHVYFTYNPQTKTGVSTIRNSWGGAWGISGLGDIAILPNQGMPGCGTLTYAYLGYGLILN